MLKLFAEASGLVTNLTKTEIFSVRCDNVNLQFITATCHSISSFPCTYLGLPLQARKPTKQTYQPMVQKIANRLSGWKRKFMTYPGRELLIKTVLTAMPTYFLTIFKPARWAISHIDRFRRSFLWKGTNPENIRGGHCLVNWETCQLPRYLGGLGIKDLENFGRVLQLRWIWHNWDNQDKPWKYLFKNEDAVDRQLFFASTYVQIGMVRTHHSGRRAGCKVLRPKK